MLVSRTAVYVDTQYESQGLSNRCGAGKSRYTKRLQGEGPMESWPRSNKEIMQQISNFLLPVNQWGELLGT